MLKCRCLNPNIKSTEAQVNSDTKADVFPALIGDVISDSKEYVDNLFADTWKKLKFNTRVKSAGFAKRSGVGVTEVVYLLMIWKWLNVSSIAMFSRKALDVFSQAKKDVMYDLLKRENLNWRELNSQAAREIYQQQKLEQVGIKTFVLDDSIKQRRGKKMEAVSSHFDHVSGRHVMGQQVLTLGLATDEAFLPLDSADLCERGQSSGVGQTLQGWSHSVVGKRYKEATTQTKPQMAAAMMKRALRAGNGSRLCGRRCVVWHQTEWFVPPWSWRSARFADEKRQYEISCCRQRTNKAGAERARALFPYGKAGVEKSPRFALEGRFPECRVEFGTRRRKLAAGATAVCSRIEGA